MYQRPQPSPTLPRGTRFTGIITLLVLVFQTGTLRATLADAPPVITEQPQPQTSFQGANVNLSVSVISAPGVRYRWRFYGTNLPNNFPGQSTPLLQLRELTTADAGPYSVVVSNNFGSVTSEEAILTVNEIVGAASSFVNFNAVPGFSLFSIPVAPFAGFELDQTVGNEFPTVLNGASIFKFDGNGFIANNFLEGWSLPEMNLTLGEGFFFHNPDPETFTLTVVGQLVEGRLISRLPAGYSVCSSLVPQAGFLSTDLNFPNTPGVRVFRFDKPSQNYLTYTSNGQDWAPVEPFLSVAEAFWVHEPHPQDWEREFNFNRIEFLNGLDGLGAAYIILQPSLANESGQVNFFTYNADGQSGRVFDLDGVTPLQSDFLGQLYAGTNDLESALRPVGKPESFLEGPGAGYIRGALVKIPGARGGQDVFLQLRVWEKCAGNTYEQAVLNGSASGRSPIFSAVAHATREEDGPGLPPRNANTFPAFSVVLGPEHPLRVARIERRQDAVEICFASQPGWIYCVQKATAARVPMTWTTIPGAGQIMGTGHVITFLDPAWSPQGFYRLCRVQ